ncbi:MAG: ABC transporter permease subunit [Defluviitaleaceae bacterium]|nr:ABC transporter permease subunit [Defluviitaleaceae bacterium]
MVKILQNFLIGSICVIFVWYIAYFLIDHPVLPNPIAVFTALPNLLNHNIISHFFHSLYRMIMGLSISMIAGLIFGLIAANKRFSKIFNPFLYFIYPIPRVAFLPVIMLVFGITNTAKIIMITIVVVFPIIVVVRDTVKQIPKTTYNSLICLGASSWQMFRTVTLPFAVAGILSTLRISIGTSMAILFFTETYGTQFGMGFFILDMWQRINYVMMFAGIVVLSLTGFMLFVLIDLLENVLLKWQK